MSLVLQQVPAATAMIAAKALLHASRFSAIVIVNSIAACIRMLVDSITCTQPPQVWLQR